MPENLLVRDLAVVLAISAAVTATFHRIGQPAVLGYLLAGMVIGPHTPPFSLVSDPHSIETLAELGMILLLFSIGLEFSFKKLRRVGGAALLGAALEVPFMIWAGTATGAALGWSRMDGLFLGSILSISSTTIIAKTLIDLGLTRELFARILVGILVVEDLAAILILVVLSGLARAGTVGIGDVVTALGAVAGFVAVLALAGYFVVPRILAFLAGISAREVLTVGVLGLCFSAALGATTLGLSSALGAFVIGAVMAESPHARAIEHRIEPLRDLFAAVFFVAVGLQIDPAVILERWPLVLGLSVLTVAGKALTCTLATMIAGYPAQTALRVGLGLGQIGEFSFIIAELGRASGLVSSFIYPVTVAVSAVTTLSTPYQIRYAESLARVLGEIAPGKLRSFVRFYDEALASGGRNARTARIAATILRPLAGTLVALLGLVLLLVGAERAANPAVALGCALVAVPLFATIWRFGTTIGESLAREVAPASSSHRTLAEAFRLAFILVVAAISLMVASAVVPLGIPLFVTISAVGLVTALFWQSIGRLQVRAKEALSAAFSGVEEQSDRVEENRASLSALAVERYPFEVVIEDLVLPLHETEANRAIRDLGLRPRTGATIAAIYRDETALVNPEPDVVLAPGDVVVLLGSRTQVERAMTYLTRLSARPCT